MSAIRFNLNGAWVEEHQLSPTTTLLRWLRDHRGLTATKEGCAEGDCGACTVAVAEVQPDGQRAWRAVNACLLLLPMLQGKHVLTLEALQRETPHPAQTALTHALGSQCGACTPGVVMTMFEATYRRDLDAAWKLEDQLAGNLCRCTGYRPIREAAQRVAGTCPSDVFTQVLAEPAESMSLDYQAQGQRFATPVTFAQLWDALDVHPDARFVVGGTDLSLEITKRFQVPPKLISLEGVKELHGISGR
jgi:xanthine dehydrogenase small subunit